MNVLGWPLKRSAIARLAAIANGSQPPPAGAELLVSAPPARPVQVEYALPAEPDRICVFGAPLSAAVSDYTSEIATGRVETVRLEIRVRVYDPGEDLDTVDHTLGDMCSAVATALLDSPSLFTQGAMYLSSYVQEPLALVPAPEPSVIGTASLVFTVQLMGF